MSRSSSGSSSILALELTALTQAIEQCKEQCSASVDSAKVQSGATSGCYEDSLVVFTVSVLQRIQYVPAMCAELKLQ
jgi:hypothetical protein